MKKDKYKIGVIALVSVIVLSFITNIIILPIVEKYEMKSICNNSNYENVVKKDGCWQCCQKDSCTYITEYCSDQQFAGQN